MAENIKKPIYTKKEIETKNLDLNDLNVLDSFTLNQNDYKIGVIKAIFFTAIAIFIFFVPITINGNTDITFGVIYNSLMKITGNFGLWFITLLIVCTGLASFYGKFLAKEGTFLYNYFEGDSVIHPFLYLIGGVFTVFYSLYATLGFDSPEVIVSSSTGGTVIPDITVAVFWIIIVGSLSMPFLLNYGVIDFFGSLFEPLMRPIWKVPGRAAINAIASFLSSSSVGVLITSKLYRQGVYTEKEAVLVATGFSAVSIGFAYMVIKTAGLQEYFLMVYFTSLLMTMIVSAIIARLRSFSKKKNIYVDGREQTAKDLKANYKKEGENIFKVAVDRAIKKASTAPSLMKEIVASLKDGFEVIPKVVSLLAAIGTLALIIVKSTPIFNWIGKLFVPLLNLLRVPNAIEIAPSFPVGIAEMFLPVLLIADKVAILEIGARYVVTTVSIIQIIFFAETIVTMMASKLPIKLWELVVVFYERTVLGIILSAAFMHILF